MSLAIGARLGPYEVVAPLGAGSMGEVYRAHDPRLGREVAIKVLPADLSADPDRLQRFEQEARAASALNHPNLLTVFDIGSHEGVPFIVFELLDGETLRQRLGPGPLPPKKALEYAVQIARGLGAAHEQGIVHRDLKPENVFVTKDGRVKILDFGLAKLRPVLDPVGAGSHVSTASALTGPGVVLGTVGYMSPEQVQGRPADARSDIFSLGTVLYEMLSGKRPFSRDSAVQTMSAILEKDPPPISAAIPELPAAVEPVVMRCLEKRPEDRFQSAPDIAFALQAIGHGSGVTPVAPATSRRPWGPLAAILAALAVGLLVAIYLREPHVPSYTRLTFRRGTVGAARFAHDGHTVVYSAAWNGKPTEVFSTRPGSIESRGLDLAGAKLLALSSRDEMAVALGWSQVPWAGEGTLARLSLAGGAARQIMESVASADWAPDGKSLAVVRSTDGHYLLEFPVGKTLYRAAEGSGIGAVRVSPRGDRVALLEEANNIYSVAVVDLAGRRQTLSTGWGRADGLAWTPSGTEVWFAATRSGFERALFSVSLSGRERLVARVPGPVALHDIAPDGRVLLGRETIRREMAGRLAGDAADRDLSWLEFSFPQDLSADGRTLVFVEAGEGTRGGTAAIYLSTDGAVPVHLGEANLNTDIRLSPDEKWVLTVHGSRLERLPTGAGEAQPISIGALEPGGLVWWFPDGKSILFAAREPSHEFRDFIVDLEGGTPRPITPEGVTDTAISPDGRRLFARGTDGRRYLFPVSGGEPVAIPGESAPNQVMGWSADSRSVYLSVYLARGSTSGRIGRLDLTTGREELWVELAPIDPAGVRAVVPSLITPDGKHYVYTFLRVLSDLYLVEGLN